MFFIFSCEDSGEKVIVQEYSNGKPALIHHFPDKNDTSSYLKEAFYESGKALYIGSIRNNRKDGQWTWWYENGNLKDQCRYAAGYYEDTIFHWSESGKLKEIEIVKPKTVADHEPTNCNGRFIYYYENGKPKTEFTWVNNIQQDTARAWYENGQLEVLSVWKDGKQTGIYLEYYPDGKKKIETTYQDGIETKLKQL